MQDSFNRKIDYLRVSITDRCNYRCVYCMPKNGVECVPMTEVLSFEEITDICRLAAKNGISKIKITGGEPLVRKGAADLVKMIGRIPGIEQITMTTNGAMLEQNLEKLKENGLSAVNISIDTLNPYHYGYITRGGDLSDAVKGMQSALNAGLKVKINTVLYHGNDWKEMICIARNLPVDVRFIEVMPIGRGKGYEGASGRDVLDYLTGLGLHYAKDTSVHGNGPASYIKVDGFQGSIGLISPIHGKFCDTCNRIRLSATGMLKPCLCYGKTFDIKTPLRNGDSEQAEKIMQEAILCKPQAHHFEDPAWVTEEKIMAKIGG